MMFTQMRLAAALLMTLISVGMSTAQEEMGDDSQPSGSWTMLSVHRTWSPQERDFPNGGFGIQSFVDLDKPRRWWLGFALRGTGVSKRDVLSLMIGPGVYLAGDSRLGLFAYVHTGLAMGSSQGLGGFDVFSDPTTTYGLATVGGIGGNIEVSKWLRLHAALVGSWFTAERGQTPYGVQIGITFGGR